MIIKDVAFIISNSEVGMIPKYDAPEYAFIGRSNVGKSSLINCLTNRKNLARVSSTPGKTRLINHFKVNDEWYMTDLPGYGYAKVSKKERKTFMSFITKYLLERENMQLLFVLIDSRHEPQQIDIDFINWLGENGVPFSILFTKTDKSKQREVDTNIEAFKKKMLEYWEELPFYIKTSSKSGMGRDRILDYIDSINQDFFKNSF